MRTFRFVLPFMIVGVGCSKLTSPPAPEPIASDTLTLASASARPPAPTTTHPMPTQLPQVPAGLGSAAQPAGELKIDDLTPGKGPQVKMGDTISVHYLGTLLDGGTKFDASRDHGQPFTFSLPGRVIEGWNKGIPGMRVGGKRKLTIPPQMGYGPRGSPPKIPPNATLVFEIELLEIKSPGPAGSNATAH